jgi:hypothetical protein
VFDTWGKIQSGYLAGNRFNFGHFTDCLNFHHETKQIKSDIIQGQYCLVGFVAMPNSSITEDNKSDGFDWREV